MAACRSFHNGERKMDLMNALAVVGQTIGIAKELRELDRSLDEASYKSKIADLYSNLADLKIALSEAREELHAKDSKVKELQAKISSLQSGEICPLCGVGVMKVTSSRSDPVFGVFGHQERTLICQNSDCGHSEKRKVIPKE